MKNDRYRNIMVAGKLLNVSETQETKNNRCTFCTQAYKNNKQIKSYVNTYMQITFLPKRCVIDNCLV
jgi:hypothetical protein